MLSRYFFLVFFLALFLGCSSKGSRIPKSENEVLNSLLHKAPMTTVELDDISVDTVFIKEENILGRINDSSLSTPIVGKVVDLIKIGDSLYVADQQQDCIWVMDRQGTWHRKIGRQGRGPGEFGFLLGMVKNSSYVYTLDKENARIQIYDYQFDLQATFDHVIFGLNGGQITATDSILYLPLSFYEYDKLIEIRQATPPFNQVHVFWPQLIPAGMQPLAYNTYYINANADSKVVVAFQGLPYIFILNSKNRLIHTIYLESARYKELENPSIKPVSRDIREGMRVQAFLQNLYLADDGSIYFQIKLDLFQIVAHETGYHLKKVWHFTHVDPRKRKAFPYGIPFTSMIVNNNIIYLGSIFSEYIYRFPLN